MAARFLDDLGAITRACRDPGPFVFAVHASRIEPYVLFDATYSTAG